MAKISLSKANSILEEIAHSDPHFTPVTQADYPLFEEFFAKEPHTYGNSWTYVTQGVYGLGPNNLGFKYYDGKNLSMVCVYPKIEQPDLNVFYWIRPMGETILDVIADFSGKLLDKQHIPTYAKKLFKDQFEYLQKKGFTDTSKFPWHSSCPLEDDTFPEQILDINKTIDIAKNLGKTRQLNRSLQNYRHFLHDNEIKQKSIFSDPKIAKKILDNFFIYQKEKVVIKNLSEPTDFYNIIEKSSSKQTTLENIIFRTDTPIGFYFVDIINDTGCLYATVTLRQVLNNLTDYVIFHILYSLAEKGVSYLNLGGSELSSLHEFKLKFKPVRSSSMFWATLA